MEPTRGNRVGPCQMIHYSVVLPQRNAVETVACRLSELCAVLTSLGEPFEVLCVDDHSRASQKAWLKDLLSDNPCLRVIELRGVAGLDAALACGIQAARGVTVVAVEASDRFFFSDLPRLIERLGRADLVWGCRRGHRLARWWRAVRRLPWTLLAGSLVRDPDCLFWAARREALAGLEWSQNWQRFLPELVSERGFRVAELHVSHRWHARRPEIDRALGWRRRAGDPLDNNSAADEWMADEAVARRFEIMRIDPPQPFNAPAPVQPGAPPRDRHRAS